MCTVFVTEAEVSRVGYLTVTAAMRAGLTLTPEKKNKKDGIATIGYKATINGSAYYLTMTLRDIHNTFFQAALGLDPAE